MSRHAEEQRTSSTALIVVAAVSGAFTVLWQFLAILDEFVSGVLIRQTAFTGDDLARGDQYLHFSDFAMFAHDSATHVLIFAAVAIATILVVTSKLERHNPITWLTVALLVVAIPLQPLTT